MQTENFGLCYTLRKRIGKKTSVSGKNEQQHTEITDSQQLHAFNA